MAVRGWAEGLAEAGADVALVDDGGIRRPTTGVESLSVPHHGPGRLRRPADLEEVLRGADVLMLHSGWVYHNASAARAANRAGIPYIVTPHGAYDPNILARRRLLKSAWLKVQESRILDGAMAVHIFFEGESEYLDRIGYRGPVIVAPNGITMVSSHVLGHRQDYALWMGRFDLEHKGVDLLLHAYAQLAGSRPPQLRLHGPDWKQGKRRAVRIVRDLGLEDSVKIGSPVYGLDKGKLLSECALFLFTSRWDSNSMVVLEAASAGAPMVVTDTTFVGRELARERAAVLVEPTPSSIAAGIREGLSDSGQETGRRAADLVRDRFSWPAVTRQFLDQLSALL
ncbi:MAG: glycosyltransferase [Gemmatimonadota bacterium]|nr:glycosyltransferase [Gemmatimonadota bacterium]